MADLASHPFADPRTWERFVDSVAARLGRDVATALGDRLARELTDDARIAAATIGADVEERFRPLRAELDRADKILSGLREREITLQETIAAIGPQIEGTAAAVVARFDRDLAERAEALAAMDLSGWEGANRQLARDTVARCAADVGEARARAADGAEQLGRLRDELTVLMKSRSGRFGWGLPTDVRVMLSEIPTKLGAAAESLAETSDVLARLEATAATLSVALGGSRTEDGTSDPREGSR